MSDYYDKQGNPLTREEYFALLDRIGPMYKLVGNTTIGDALVSTVWLGLDHSYDNGEPVIFESMIFGGDRDEYSERYSTLEEAQQGHLRLVNELQASHE